MKKLLTPAQLSERWDISERTLSQWRWLSRGPRYLKIEGAVRYPLDAVESYEASAERNSA